MYLDLLLLAIKPQVNKWQKDCLFPLLIFSFNLYLIVGSKSGALRSMKAPLFHYSQVHSNLEYLFRFQQTDLLKIMFRICPVS